MINITYRPDSYSITIKGHANFKEKGKDIVCAAASMLFYTLAACLAKAPDGWFAEKPDMADYLSDPEKKGVSHIRCTPKSDFDITVLIMYQTIVTGFEQLAANYPDYVNLKITQK